MQEVQGSSQGRGDSPSSSPSAPSVGPRVALTGPYKGHRIRRARKSYRCENWPASSANAHTIVKGELYVEGDVNPDLAGGFGAHRICLICAESAQ